jgi:hypothetical protein
MPMKVQDTQGELARLMGEYAYLKQHTAERQGGRELRGLRVRMKVFWDVNRRELSPTDNTRLREIIATIDKMSLA